MASKLVNFALYQVGWFCCVLGGAYEYPWWGAGAGLLLLLVHLALLPHRVAELRVVLAAGLLGGVADSLQSCAGLLTFRSGYVVGCLAPPWIVVMWMQFATLFGFGLSFLRGRYLLAGMLAAVGGPLAFWVGGNLGAVRFAEPASLSLIVLGAIWAVSLPLLLKFAEAAGGFSDRYFARKKQTSSTTPSA